MASLIPKTQPKTSSALGKREHQISPLSLGTFNLIIHLVTSLVLKANQNEVSSLQSILVQ